MVSTHDPTHGPECYGTHLKRSRTRKVDRCCREGRVKAIRRCAPRNPNGLRRRGPERAFPMWKRTTVTVTVKVDAAKCLWALVALLNLLM